MYGYNPFMAQTGAQPFGGLYDTSGPGDDGNGGSNGSNDDDAGDEGAAEVLSEQFLDAQEAQEGDTGAIGLRLPNINQIGTSLAGMLGFNPSPAKVAKVARKVKAKIQAKAPARQARAAARPAFRMPVQRLVQPVMGPVAGRTSSPITSMAQLMERVTWAQLASLTGGPLTVGIGATTTTTIPVTRTGWVLDWATNSGCTGTVCSALTYAQQPYAVFNATPLECWSPLAANPTPVPPLYVTMPANLQVTITNPTAAALIVTWTMSGIPDEHIPAAMADQDVRRFLAARGMSIAKSAQGGYGEY